MITADLIRERFATINSEAVNYSGGKIYAEPSKIRIFQFLMVRLKF